MEELALLRTVEKDDEWLRRNFGRIQEKHPNKFVAISKEHVIAHAGHSEDVVRKVEKKGIDPATTLIEFIPRKGLILIL